jgi:AraC family transcriptional regulator
MFNEPRPCGRQRCKPPTDLEAEADRSGAMRPSAGPVAMPRNAGAQDDGRGRLTGRAPRLFAVEVIREGQAEPLLHAQPNHSSAAVGWSGLVLEDHSVPALMTPRHEHVDNFVHVVLRGSVRCEVSTRGKTLQFGAGPGTTFILPRGTVDELTWSGPTDRLAVAIHPHLLVSALDETAHKSDIELTEHWNLTDPHILAVLLAMRNDLEASSPAGRLYGESLCNALAVYLLNRYAVRRCVPGACRGGLPGYRLRRVLDYIGDNLATDLSLGQLAAVAGMSPHYFTEMFKKSKGQTPHQYVLLQRIEQAKNNIIHNDVSIIEAGMDAGFPNPSHFACAFRKLVGMSPSQFKSEVHLRPRRS